VIILTGLIAAGILNQNSDEENNVMYEERRSVSASLILPTGSINEHDELYTDGIEDQVKAELPCPASQRGRCIKHGVNMYPYRLTC